MRMQSKLFVLLLAVGILPLVLVASVSMQGSARFGRQAGDELERELVRMVSSQVERDAEAASAAVTKGTGAARAALRALVRETQTLLADRFAASRPLYFSEDFDTPGRVPGGTNRSGHGGGLAGELTVHFEELVFVTAPGVERASVRADAARLARLLPLCKNLFSDLGGSAYRIFVTLESGLTAAYPGFGGYPDNFDPRLASWYSRARASGGGPVWSELLISRSTGTALFSLTSPVRGPDGSFAGVASVELPLGWFLQEAQLASSWSGGMHSFLVGARRGDASGRVALNVLAAREYGSGGSQLVGEAYRLLDPSEAGPGLDTLARDLAAGGSGTMRMDYRGTDSIWAWAPLAQGGMGFLLVVPASVVESVPTRLKDMVGQSREIQWFVTYAAAVFLALAAALAAWLVARRGAGAARVMASAWQRLARGDFGVRLDLRFRDERDDLVRAFNDTVPKLAERIRLKRSVSMVREVQQRMLPGALPTVPGLDVAGTVLYCEEAGGDFYDAFVTPEGGRLLVAVGDVSGHDVAASLLMASALAYLRSAGRSDAPLDERVAEVNRLLTADVAGSGRFVTLLGMEFDGSAGTLRWVRAGHEPGWLLDPDTGEAFELGGEGAALGFSETTVCALGRVPFERPGTLAVACSDGVLEAENGKGEPFGRRRLLEAVRSGAGQDAATVVRSVTEALDAFLEGAKAADDVSVVAVMRTGERRTS